MGALEAEKVQNDFEGNKSILEIDETRQNLERIIAEVE